MISGTVKDRLKVAAAVIGLVGASWGFISGAVLLPYRVQALEGDAKEIKAEQRELKDLKQKDHELTVRIEERLIDVQRRMDRWSRDKQQ